LDLVKWYSNIVISLFHEVLQIRPLYPKYSTLLLQLDVIFYASINDKALHQQLVMRMESISVVAMRTVLSSAR